MVSEKLKLRARPYRVGFMVSQEVTREKMLEIIEFLSSLWGSNYCPIIPVDRQNLNLSSYWYNLTQPDIVYSDIPTHLAKNIFKNSANPLRYCKFDSNTTVDIYDHNPLSLVTSLDIVNNLIDSEYLKDKNYLLFKRNKFKYLPYFYSLWGSPPDPIKDIVKDYSQSKIQNIKKLSFREYLSFFSRNKDSLSWNDIANTDLNEHALPIQPTIVVIKKPIDHSIVWNLRMGNRENILPVPFDEMFNNDSVKAVIEWLNSLHIRTNSCRLTSICLDESLLKKLCQKIKRLLRKQKSQFQFVDYIGINQTFESVIPSNARALCDVQISDNTVDFTSPKLTIETKSKHSWMVDILPNERGRSPFELCLPFQQNFLEILNVPHPPQVLFFPTLRLANHDNYISIICQGNNKKIYFPIPSSEELIENILKEHHFKINSDEKRSCYEAVLEKYGGLAKVAKIFSSKSQIIIDFLLEKQEPVSVGKLRSLIKKDDLTKDYWLDHIRRYTPLMKQIANERFEKYSSESHKRIKNPLSALFEEWSHKKILKRAFQLPKCHDCEKRYWTENITVNAKCPGCGLPLYFEYPIDIGYELNPLFKVALKEGLQSVILTGRFLKNLTHKGFIWLPGIKFSKGKKKYDIDIMAICDGFLVLAECKSLYDVKTRNVWDDIVQQFKTLVELATILGAKVVVLSILGNSFPKSVEKTIKKSTPKDIKSLLLTGLDLEKGRRKILRKDVGIEVDLSMSNIVYGTSCRYKKRRFIGLG